jgi:hypothetical protein
VTSVTKQTLETDSQKHIASCASPSGTKSFSQKSIADKDNAIVLRASHLVGCGVFGTPAVVCLGYCQLSEQAWTLLMFSHAYAIIPLD